MTADGNDFGESLRRGDAAEFARAFEDHHAEIWGYLARRYGTSAADDLAGEYDSFPVVPNIDTGSGESDSAALSKYFDELPPLVLDGYAPDGTVIGTLTLTMQGG